MLRRLLSLVLAPLERLFALTARTRPVHPDGEGLLLVSYHRYRGRPLTLPDGTTVARGTPVGELHMSNRLMARADKDGRASEWSMLRAFRRELALLAAEVAAGRVPPEVAAFYGATLVAPGAKRLGFYERPLPPAPGHRLLAAWERLLARAYAASFARTRAPRALTEVWITRRQLLALSAGPGTAVNGRPPGGQPLVQG